jgi:two-component system cell cycle sensor histidine kinase/response regulator CckA
MDDGLRILIVEDLPTDAELAEREVRRVLPGSEFLRVETEEDYLAALASFRPDAILSDYKLPRFDGMSALKLALERTPETPFIVVTGSMNEDTAVECMKAGAWDYVIKEHIKRLGPAVEGGLARRRMRRERKISADALDARNRGFTILAEAGLGLAEARSALELYPVVARTLKDLAGGEAATFGLYDSLGKCIRVMHAEYDRSAESDLAGQFGAKRLTDLRFPISDAALRELERNPIGYGFPLGEEGSGVVPDLVQKIGRKLPGVDRFLGIAYWQEGELYGNSLVALRAGTPDPALDLVSLFAQMVAVSLGRVRADASLQESEERFRQIFESANVGKSVTSPTGEMNVNKAFCDLLGYTREELENKRWQDLTPPDDIDLTQRYVDQLLKGPKNSARFTKRFIRKDGSHVWVDLSSVLRRDREGKPLHLITTIVDMTERRQAEAEVQTLLRSVQREKTTLSALINSITDEVWFADTQGRFTLANPSALKTFGLVAGQPIDIRSLTRSLEVMRSDGSIRPLEEAPPLRALAGEVLVDLEEIVRTPAMGQLQVRQVSASPVRDSAGTIIGAVAVVRDVTESRRAEKELRSLAARNGALLGAIPDIIMEVGNDKIYRWANPAGVEFFGEDVIGQEAARYFVGEQDTYDRVRPLFTGDENTIYLESWQRRRDGEKRLLAWWCRVLREPDGSVSGALSTARDITEQRLLEDQLRQAQKMETVGQLAGGVAHDFNNMLQVITSYAEMALGKVADGQPLHKYLLEIRRAAQRSAEITGQLLAFARKQTVSPKVLDLNEALADTQKMIQRLIGEDIDLAWLPGHGLWKVMIDPAQLDQILANLSVNARDAIGGVGKVTAETENVSFDEAYCAAHAGFVPGAYVLLAISDDGHGMDQETMSHLFEPFFTTKEQGKGTGLGLATVYGIVKQNNGFINVYSEPGHGSTFKVYLPRAEGVTPGEGAEVEAAAPRGGTETVLVVEDEAAILELAKESLEELGYTVLTASSPEEALRTSKERGAPIDLLITDVVMPGMNGRELARRLGAARPELKCLYMSGYTADVIAHRGVLEEGVSFIGKPFSLTVLAKKVREVLDG